MDRLIIYAEEVVLTGTKNVTLREVAVKAGVSIATVSRVLNKSNYVNPDIEKKVNRVIRELGYFQNAVARSLKTNSTMIVGFVTADISNPYMITVAKAIEDVIREKGYNLLVSSTEGDVERELEHLHLLMGRNVDGIVLNGTGLNKDFIARISKKTPVILLHRRCDSSEFIGDFVDSDNICGMYRLTKQLISLGHRKIFIIKGSMNASSNKDRHLGFCKAMEEEGIKIDDTYPFQYSGDFRKSSGFQAIDFLCGIEEKPTAILSYNNTMMLGALECMKQRNIRAPEDYTLATYNNIEGKELMTVRPTVYNVDPREIGLQVGDLLYERIQNNRIPYREMIVEGVIELGNTVGIPRELLAEYNTLTM